MTRSRPHKFGAGKKPADGVAVMAEVANSVDEVLAHVSKKLDAYSGAMPLRGRPSRGREAVN